MLKRPVVAAGETQSAAREHVLDDDAQRAWSRKKGEPLSVEGGRARTRHSLEGIRQSGKPRGKGGLDRVVRWCRTVVEHTDSPIAEVTELRSRRR